MTHTGSLLASLKDSLLSPELKTLRDTIRNIRFAGAAVAAFAAQTLARARQDIGAGGEKLSGFLATLRANKSPAAGGVAPVLPLLRDFRVQCPGWLEALF